MIKDLTGVTIVLILVLGGLLYTWTDRRRKTRRADLKETHDKLGRAVKALNDIRYELQVQSLAGTSDTSQIQRIILDYDLPTTTTTKGTNP